jgi:hypothetical protein
MAKTPKYVRSTRRPAGEIPKLPPCACGAPSVVWAQGRAWCDPCSADFTERQAAATLAEELDRALDDALEEDRSRSRRPELYVACPKCGAAAGARCRDYRNVKKATCRERLEAPEVLAANARILARGRAHAHPFFYVNGYPLSTLQPLDVCTGCEEACGFCPHRAREPEPVALERGAGGEVLEGERVDAGCCAEKSGGGTCSSRASALVLVPGLGHVRACSKHARRHEAHQAGKQVRAVKWHAPGVVDAQWHSDDLWRVQREITKALDLGAHIIRRAAADLDAGQLSLFA